LWGERQSIAREQRKPLQFTMSLYLVPVKNCLGPLSSIQDQPDHITM